MPPRFAWDHRPGRNVEHIASNGMTTELWEEVYHKATQHAQDKDDETVTVAEGRAHGKKYRIIYTIEEGEVVPLSIVPITGFSIERRGLR